MHRFSSRSDDLTRRVTEVPASVLYGTLRRPTERNTGRADDFFAAVENLCIVRANGYLSCRKVIKRIVDIIVSGGIKSTTIPRLMA